WRLALISQTLFNIVFWWTLFSAWTHPTSAATFCLIFGLAAAKGWMRLNAVATVLPAEALSKHRWSYILGVPFIASLYQYNLIRSSLTRDIVWRQIRYTLISPRRTVVQRGGEEN